MAKSTCTYFGRFITFITVGASDQESFEQILADDRIEVKFCEKVKAYEIQCVSAEERTAYKALITEAMKQAEIEIKMQDYTLPEKYWTPPPVSLPDIAPVNFEEPKISKKTKRGKKPTESTLV